MKADWDARARADLYRYVDHRARTDAELAALGERDTGLLLADVGAFLDPPRQAAVEIGCGPGRLLQPLAARFREVWGTDVSREMVDRARRRVEGLEHVRVLETAGDDLAGLPSGYFGFCCSAFVFECIPEPAVIRRNLEEAHRVLAPGGFLKFNAAGVFAHNPFRRHYDAQRDTWSGARFTMSELVGLTEAAGFEVWWAHHAREVAPPHREADLESEYRIWVTGRKGPGMDQWESVCWHAGRGLARAVPAGAAVVMIDPCWSAQVAAAASLELRFLDFYRPATGAAAVSDLERLRAGGGQYLLMTRFASWWRQSFPELFVHLAASYRTVEETEDFLLVDLRAGAAPIR